MKISANVVRIQLLYVKDIIYINKSKYLMKCCIGKTILFQYLKQNKIVKNTNLKFVTGIVHPKMQILSLFTHSQVVPNLYEFLCSAKHKERYSEESL